MKLILVCSLLASFVACKSWGQTEAIDYSFINAALKQVDKYDSTYFLLQDKTYKCYLSEDQLHYYNKELRGKIPLPTLKEIVKNAQLNKNIELAFDPKQISKESGARIISAITVDSMQRNRDIRIPLNKRLFYICSLPVYDNSKRYAVISFGGGIKRLEMVGKKYLFKKIKDKWVLITTFDSWVT